MKIDLITVTGADNSVSIDDIARLSARYPQVEFAILLSRNSMGSTRFPSEEWLKELKNLPITVPLSGHLCGSWVREIFQGKWPYEELDRIFGFNYFERFDRWQLNTHGHKTKWDESIADLFKKNKQTIIFQYDNKNREPMDFCIKAGVPNVSALFDLSHGTGVLPSEWPKPIEGVHCGYAGGLSPENVSSQCQKIASVVGDARIWIDAETHLRSHYDHYFDWKLVEQFIVNALPYTV